MAITSAFQADDAGSISAVRSSPYFRINTSGVHTLEVPQTFLVLKDEGLTCTTIAQFNLIRALGFYTKCFRHFTFKLSID